MGENSFHGFFCDLFYNTPFFDYTIKKPLHFELLFFYYNVLSIYCTFSVLVLLHVVIGVASALLDTLYDGDGNECVLTDDDDKEGEDEEEDVEEVEDDDDDDSV